MTVDSESTGLSDLAAEFPGYDFGTQQTWDGTSIIAIRQRGSDRPGLCVMITADVDEMRHALREADRQGGVIQAIRPEIAAREDPLPEPRAGALDEDRG